MKNNLPKPLTLIKPAKALFVCCKPGKSKWIALVATIATTKKEAISKFNRFSNKDIHGWKYFAMQGWKILPVNILLSINKK